MNTMISYAGVVHPHDLERLGKEVTKFSREAGRKEFTHDPYRIVAKDGEIKWLDDITIGEYAVLAVSDDGLGISSDDLERVFEPFKIQP